MAGSFEAGQTAMERFHFGDSGHVTPEQMRTLRSLDELLARNLTHALSAWLRTDVSVSAGPQTQGSFQEFLEGAEGCSLMPVHLSEAHATGLLRWPLPLAAHMIELLLGGSGSNAAEVRELTEIEDEIFCAVLAVIEREWNLAWQQIALTLELGERSRNAAERQLLLPADKVYCFHLDLRVDASQGAVSLCLPTPVLASIMRRIPPTQRQARSYADTATILRALDDSRVQVGLCFPPVRMLASRLAELQPGKTLVLPLQSNSPAEFRVSEVPVLEAAPVRLGAWRAANITGPHGACAQRALVAGTAGSRQLEESGAHA